MKTEFIIKVLIEHDADRTKHQALKMWCPGLKVGQNWRGSNGFGEGYTLDVVSIKEIPKKKK